MDKNLENLISIAKGNFYYKGTEESIREALDTDIYKEPYENIKKLAGEEHVNHPSHYNRPNSMECIDEMILIFGREAVMNFCLCNSWKYRYRAGDKNGAEDLAKSDWYIAKYKELKDEKQWKAATSVTLNPTYESGTITIPGNTKVETRNTEYINNNEYDPKLVQ